jgi:hypothetical protein
VETPGIVKKNLDQDSIIIIRSHFKKAFWSIPPEAGKNPFFEIASMLIFIWYGARMAKLAWGIVSFAVIFIFSSNYVAARNYYPLINGMKWEYGTERTFSFKGDGNTVNYTYNVKCLGINRIDKKKDVFIFLYGSGYKNYLTKDKQGIAYYAYQRAGDSEHTYYEPSIPILRYPLVVGHQWGIHRKIWYMNEKPLVPFNYAVESFGESVVVPAGKYDNCLYIRKRGTKRYETQDSEGIFKFTWELTAEGHNWYAPNVGWIKGIEEVSINMVEAYHMEKKSRVPLDELKDPGGYKNRKIKSVTALINQTSE